MCKFAKVKETPADTSLPKYGTKGSNGVDNSTNAGKIGLVFQNCSDE